MRGVGRRWGCTTRVGCDTFWGMEDLFKSAVVVKGKRRREDDDDSPVMVSDAGQIKKLIVEAVMELVDGGADYVKMTMKEMVAAGYRPWVDDPGPWVVDQLVVSKVGEEQFKAMVKYSLNPKESGTGAFGLVRREANGDWAVAAVQVRDGTVVKLDHKRERSRSMQTGGDGIEWDSSAPPPGDFVGVRKPVVEWVVVWVDRNKNPGVKRDMHGKEVPAVEVKVDTGGDRLAVVMERLMEERVGKKGG